MPHTEFKNFYNYINRKKQTKLLIFYVIQYIQNTVISIGNQYKNMNGTFYLLFYNKSSKRSIYFTLTHFNLDSPYFKCSKAQKVASRQLMDRI